MTRETIVILGIPVDDLDTDETVERIFDLVRAYSKDSRPRQVATVNVDFVVNTLSWRLSKQRHPELVDILRRADLVTPDGMPIIWTARLLGTPLKTRVAGADLVPRLAQEAALRNRSLYFLGGREDVGREAARILTEQFPELKVAGIDSPMVSVTGEGIADEISRDLEIVERINRSGADILLIAFGNPKQEIWFDRNRHRLRVPVSIGIGGSYEFIAGTVARAPMWMQRAGLEWIFRITQDPKRLWKRYLVGFFKFGIMILPAIIDYRLRRRQLKGKPPASCQLAVQTLPGAVSGPDNIRVIGLPPVLDAAVLATVREPIENDVFASDEAILDFENVTFIDSSGLGFMISLWRRAREEHRSLYFTRIRPQVRRILKLSRSLDLFSDWIFGDVETALEQIRKATKRPPFYSVETPHRLGVVFRLFGVLDAAQVGGIDSEAFLSRIGGGNCFLDLKGLAFVDSTGIGFFLKISRHLQKTGKRCVLVGARENVRQMLRITRLDRLFQVAADMAAAERLLVASPR